MATPFIDIKVNADSEYTAKSVVKMKNKIRELTDRNKGISNEEREKKYQEYVRGWVEYFRLADMKETSQKERMNGQDGESERSIGNSGRKSKRRYRMLKALGLEHWKAKELAM